MTAFDIGDVVRITGTFTNLAGTPTNPTTTTIKTKDPAGATVSYTGGQLSSGGTGIVYVDIAPVLAGVWSFRAEGVGAVAAAAEDQFLIRAGAF